MKHLKWFALGTTVTAILTYLLYKYQRNRHHKGCPCVNGTKTSAPEEEMKYPNEAPEKVDRTKKTIARLGRNKNFKEFYSKAKNIFEPLGRNDKNAEDYRNFNMLCVCPGSRAGGQEHDIVEVFWGSRLMETDEKVAMGRKTFEAKYEYGSTMIFAKQENGYVSVYLKPSHINYKKPEACIVWKKSVDPARLLKPWYQRYLWGGFMAYMEVTSTDGKPSCLQSFRIFILRLIRPVIEEVNKPYPYSDKDGVVRITEITENVERPIRLIRVMQTVLKWVFQVSLSGVFIFLIPILFPKESDETKELKTIEKQMESIISEIKKQHIIDLDCIEHKLDSISLYIQRWSIPNDK